MRDFSVYVNWDTQTIKIDAKEVYETNEARLFLDGVVLNSTNLCENSSKKSFQQYFVEKMKQKEYSLLKRMSGEFNGFVYWKETHEILFFTNLQATRKMFYHLSPNGVIFSNRIQTIIQLQKEYKISYSLDMESAYAMLTMGNLLENNTLIREIKKLHSAEVLELSINEKKKRLFCYHDLRQVEPHEKSMRQNVEEFHERFSLAIQEEYQLDINLGESSLAFLSGGLDSRMNVLTALQQNQNLKEVLCFSQTDYLDHTISKQIAKDFHLKYDFVPLDDIDFVLPIDQLTALNEFSVVYNGSSHVEYALSKMNYSDFSTIHSGQIGDGILGNFNSSTRLNKPIASSMVKRKRHYHTIRDSIEKIASQYPTEELYKLYNLAFNRTVAGSYVTEQYFYLLSPFFHPEVIHYALSISPELKFNHRFYFQWMKQKVPASTRYIWETTAMKPLGAWTKPLGQKVVKRIRKTQYQLKGENYFKYHMNPYQYYFDNDPKYLRYFNDYFSDTIEYLDRWKELKVDVTQQYKEGDFQEKVMALTLISSIKQLF